MNSLEDKSKNRRQRLHYHKFAKSKDLSLRSSTDIDLILGRHKRKKPTAQSSDSSDDTKPKDIHKLEKESDEEENARPSFQLNPMQILNAPVKSNDIKTSNSTEESLFNTNP